MHTSRAPISLADLSTAGIRLRPEEAVTIVRELILQVIAGETAGVPSAHVIRLLPPGSISVEGPVAAGEPTVVRAAQLLDSLLQGREDDDGAARMPGGLKLVLARALRTLDLPPFGSLSEFAQALGRFATDDPSAVVSNLVDRWAAATSGREASGVRPDAAQPQAAKVEPFAPAEAPVRAAAPARILTISDLRRARRATGLSLVNVSDRSGIPVGLLRQLEWGYLLNWPTGSQGRGMLARYARAAGLDAGLVVALVWPLVEEVRSLRALFASRGPADDSTASPRLTETRLEGLVPVSDRRTVLPPAPRSVRRSGRRALVAAAALLMAGLPVVWLAMDPDRLRPLPSDRQAGPAQPGDADGLASAGDRPELTAPLEEPVMTPPLEQAAAGEQRRTSEAPERSAVRAEPPAADSRVSTTGGSGDEMSAAASVGAAVFHAPGAPDRPGVVGASGTGPDGTVLRVTRIVDNSANTSHVRPSPDGRFVAFDSDRHGARAVYVADADGRNVQRVSPEGLAAMPSWSPDGRSLAFVRAEADRPEVWNLWTLDRQTGTLRQVTRHAYGQPHGSSWCPTGDRIVYGLGDRLIIHDLGSGTERVFTSPKPGREVRSPVASPDGRRVVFQVRRDGTWLLDVTNGAMRRVLDDPTAVEYAWSPDGSQLAYHSARSGGWGVWVMAPR